MGFVNWCNIFSVSPGIYDPSVVGLSVEYLLCGKKQCDLKGEPSMLKSIEQWAGRYLLNTTKYYSFGNLIYANQPIAGILWFLYYRRYLQKSRRYRTPIFLHLSKILCIGYLRVQFRGGIGRKECTR